jgi:hypothetical protein
VKLMLKKWPGQCFEFHAHNDYGLATANCLAAIAAGARGVHTSVNGMGERTGNTRLAEVVAAIHDHTKLRTRVREDRLSAVSRLVEIFSGKDIAANTPIVGRDVFTQTAGIHADGDLKGDLYGSRLAPARFGQKRRYALGKLSGKASIDQNLAKLGIELSSEVRDQVLARVVELGDKKHTVMPEDLRFIIADVLKTPREQLMRVETYEVTVGSGVAPTAQLTLSYDPFRFVMSYSYLEANELKGGSGISLLRLALAMRWVHRLRRFSMPIADKEAMAKTVCTLLKLEFFEICTNPHPNSVTFKQNFFQTCTLRSSAEIIPKIL